ncbi:hypothetical protein KC19_1G171000 [Ceratodon purpureus]|uniref:Uncharacterized protein n=1 Tax=Ceratodon purpureus TaxID=3225 RepID=A0A8T0J614_CERPU|nr:hypothetical protein KC19_1G171000 [Ceratodon purpureus]
MRSAPQNARARQRNSHLHKPTHTQTHTPNPRSYSLLLRCRTLTHLNPPQTHRTPLNTTKNPSTSANSLTPKCSTPNAQPQTLNSKQPHTMQPYIHLKNPKHPPHIPNWPAPRGLGRQPTLQPQNQPSNTNNTQTHTDLHTHSLNTQTNKQQ